MPKGRRTTGGCNPPGSGRCRPVREPPGTRPDPPLVLFHKQTLPPRACPAQAPRLVGHLPAREFAKGSQRSLFHAPRWRLIDDRPENTQLPDRIYKLVEVNGFDHIRAHEI